MARWSEWSGWSGDQVVRVARWSEWSGWPCGQVVRVGVENQLLAVSCAPEPSRKGGPGLGEHWRRMLHILAERAQRGLRVRQLQGEP